MCTLQQLGIHNIAASWSFFPFFACFCLSVRQLYLTIGFGDNYSVFLWFFFSLLGEHLSDMPAQNKAHPALRQYFNFSSTTTAECVWVCLQQQCFPGTNCGKVCLSTEDLRQFQRDRCVNRYRRWVAGIQRIPGSNFVQSCLMPSFKCYGRRNEYPVSPLANGYQWPSGQCSSTDSALQLPCMASPWRQRIARSFSAWEGRACFWIGSLPCSFGGAGHNPLCESRSHKNCQARRAASRHETHFWKRKSCVTSKSLWAWPVSHTNAGGWSRDGTATDCAEVLQYRKGCVWAIKHSARNIICSSLLG